MGYALGSIAALFLLMYASVASRHLATLSIEGSDLVVTMRGLNKVWAMKSRIVIPIASIESVRVMDARPLRRGLRFPGSAVPGLIFAGSYLKSGEWSFFAVRTGEEAVVIEASAGRYRRIVIETVDPYRAVALVKDSLGRTVGTS